MNIGTNNELVPNIIQNMSQFLKDKKPKDKSE